MREECFYFMQINLALTDRECMLKRRNPVLLGTCFAQGAERDHGQKQESCVMNLTFPALLKCHVHSRGQCSHLRIVPVPGPGETAPGSPALLVSQ